MPRPQVGAALALLQLGRDSEALQRYASARNTPGFASDPTLESRLEKAKPAAPARFAVVQGGKSDTVVNFAPPPGRARIGFADIAGLEDLKRTVRLQIIEPFLEPGIFAKFKKQAGGRCVVVWAAGVRQDHGCAGGCHGVPRRVHIHRDCRCAQHVDWRKRTQPGEPVRQGAAQQALRVVL